MTFRDRLFLWGLGLFMLTPLLLLPLLGTGGIVIDIMASAMFLAGVSGMTFLVIAARPNASSAQGARRS